MEYILSGDPGTIRDIRRMCSRLEQLGKVTFTRLDREVEIPDTKTPAVTADTKTPVGAADRKTARTKKK